MIGETIGNFRILRRLGEGGMGEVFLGEQQSIETKVAIKLLLPHVSSHRDHVQRFFNEARAVSRIRHAGIVKIFDVGFHSNGRAYLIMEFLEGESLATMVERGGTREAGVIIDLGRQIAGVLAATHAAGIVHRDLKPDNVFLVPDLELARGTRVKILDFGIAKLTGTMAVNSPQTVGTMGTPSYMAPEQWADSRDVDAKADIYSLGCLLFEMACGRPPFVASTIAEAYHQHLNASPPRMRTLSPWVSADLEDLVMRLLAKQAAQRPPINEVIKVFDGLASISHAGTSSRHLVATVHAMSGDGPRLSANTTLGGAVGQELAGAKTSSSPRSRLLMIAGGALAVVGIVSVVALSRGKSNDRPSAHPPSDAALATESVDAGAVTSSAPPKLKERIEATNPFVTTEGGVILAHQVTKAEYRLFLESLPPNDRISVRPLRGWSDTPGAHEQVSVSWVTWNGATRFCEALDAALPSDDAWVRASGGAWGLDPTGSGVVGPLQEWTGTAEDGLAIVRGGHAKMNTAHRRQALDEPLYKSTGADSREGAPASTVAGDTIGFRCAR